MIDNLPIELLSEIFLFGHQRYLPPDPRAIKLLGAIVSTCRTWRNTALGTSLLWTNIVYIDYAARARPFSPMPQCIMDRLNAYLMRSKSRSILVHLLVGYCPAKLAYLRDIIHPHLSRCHTINLRFYSRDLASEFLPLPGSMSQMTAFGLELLDQGGAEQQPPIFAESDGGVHLRKLVLINARVSLEQINTNVTEIRLEDRGGGTWHAGIALIAQSHSLSGLTLRGSAISLPSILHPELTYFDTSKSPLPPASLVPKLQSLVIRGWAVLTRPIPSWPLLRTLCVIFVDVSTWGPLAVFRLNPTIQHLLVKDCRRVGELARLICGDEIDGADAADIGSPLLPSLSLFRVLCTYHSTDLDESDIQALRLRRPGLRIERERTRHAQAASRSDNPGIIKASIEALPGHADLSDERLTWEVDTQFYL